MGLWTLFHTTTTLQGVDREEAPILTISASDFKCKIHYGMTLYIGLFLQPTLMYNSITTCMSHYYPRHVSGLDMPILRRNNCTNTASGILTLELSEQYYI